MILFVYTQGSYKQGPDLGFVDLKFYKIVSTKWCLGTQKSRCRRGSLRFKIHYLVEGRFCLQRRRMHWGLQFALWCLIVRNSVRWVGKEAGCDFYWLARGKKFSLGNVLQHCITHAQERILAKPCILNFRPHVLLTVLAVCDVKCSDQYESRVCSGSLMWGPPYVKSTLW